MATILLLCEYPTLCGGERSMLSTLNGVRAAGFRVMVAAPPSGSLARSLAAMAVVHLPFSTVEPGGRRRGQAALRNEIAHLLRRCRPDLLHANSLAMGRLSGPVAAEACVASVAHLRDIVRLSRQAVADLNRHRRLLAVSGAARQYHLAGGLDTEKTRVLYNGVDLVQFQPQRPTGHIHRELGLTPDTRLVGMIGQICLRKGHDVFTEAAEAVSARLGDVHFLIAGQCNSRKAESVEFNARLHAASTQGPLAGRLHLLGERDDVGRLLRELTLLVHSARQEPLGRVLLEGAAAGAAIVATDVGGTREIFPPGSGAAQLVCPGNAPALAEAMDGLLRDGDRCRALGRAARARAEAAFGIERAMAGLVRHYQELCR